MYRHINDCDWNGNITGMLFTNLSLATMTEDKPYGLVTDGALVTRDQTIQWVGKKSELPDAYKSIDTIDLEGCLITPGLIDCHTHVVFGGNRAHEFEMRLEGASYEEVARAGGGIVSTVAATRAASEEALLNDASKRIDALIREGVTSLEIKSGYGLDKKTELKMLRVARQLTQSRLIDIKTSFLGAHAIPPEFSGKADEYIDTVCIPALEAAHEDSLVDAVDGFCEGIAFNPTQIMRVFDKAIELRLPVKLHAEQLSNLGGAKLAAKYGALSADHLEYLDEAGVRAMAEAGTVAVLLPGAYYTLRETQLPPIEQLRNHRVPIAIATDCNPGSSPLTSVLLTMNMACTLFRMTPEEALRAVTCHAAKALAYEDRGMLESGKRADFCVWDVKHPAELAYRIGFNPLRHRVYKGEFV